MGASEMPLQLEFDYRLSRSIKERLKRQCFKPYSYFTSSSQYYRVFVHIVCVKGDKVGSEIT